MNEILRSRRAIVAVLVLLAGAGCVTESSNTTGNRMTPAANTNATGAAATTPVSMPAKTVTATPNTQPVTLAVLDAFFAQEGFAAELKAKLQLTDEQVNTLRNIGRRETSRLRESDRHDEYAGRTRRASRQPKGR